MDITNSISGIKLNKKFKQIENQTMTEFSRTSVIASRHTGLGSGLEDWDGMGTVGAAPFFDSSKLPGHQ